MRRSRGFSLVEIMVVVIIIGLLAGAVALRVSGYVDTAKVNRAKADIATLTDAIEGIGDLGDPAPPGVAEPPPDAAWGVRRLGRGYGMGFAVGERAAGRLPLVSCGQVASHPV